MVQFPRYESYKDSGVKWIGDIPSHWDIKSLRSLLENRNEKNSPVKTEDILSLSIANGVTPYSDENRGGNKAKSDLTAYKLAYPQDIVLNSMNVIVGAVGLSKYFGAISPVYYALYVRNEEKADISFYDKIFSNTNFQKSLRQYGKGILIKKSDSGKLNTIRMKISVHDLKKVSLPLPPINEQKQIAKFLDSKCAEIDEAIAKKQKLIELLQEQKAILINRAVTKGLNPNVTMCDRGIEWIGEIPEHWEIKKLKHISKVQSGITLGKVYTGSNLVTYPYLRVANVQYGYFALDDVAELTLPEEISNKYFIKPGDILVTEGGDIDKLGRGTVWEGQIEKCLHQNHIFAIHIIQKYASEYFVSLSMGSDYGRKYFTTTGIQTTNLASTNKTKLGNLPVLLPPKEEQLKIIDYARIVEEKYLHIINLTTQEINSLHELKQVMISNAVTGKIKI